MVHATEPTLKCFVDYAASVACSYCSARTRTRISCAEIMPRNWQEFPQCRVNVVKHRGEFLASSFPQGHSLAPVGIRSVWSGLDASAVFARPWVL
jgi:hypothetical protein